MRLAGLVALVTGASSGIGAATARVLAAQGASVAVLARRMNRLDDLVAETPGNAMLAVEADLTDAAQATAAVDQAVARFGRLDMLVNNAGVMLLGPFEGSAADEWQQMVSLNLTGLFQLTHAALPHLLDAADTSEQRIADIVNISSVGARTIRPGSGVYSATKAALNAFTESLRQEVAVRGVRVSLVEPGAVRTELMRHVRPDVRDAMLSDPEFSDVVPLRASEVADAIEYIVSRPSGVTVSELMIRPTRQTF